MRINDDLQPPLPNTENYQNLPQALPKLVDFVKPYEQYQDNLELLSIDIEIFLSQRGLYLAKSFLDIGDKLSIQHDLLSQNITESSNDFLKLLDTASSKLVSESDDDTFNAIVQYAHQYIKTTNQMIVANSNVSIDVLTTLSKQGRESNSGLRDDILAAVNLGGEISNTAIIGQLKQQVFPEIEKTIDNQVKFWRNAAFFTMGLSILVMISFFAVLILV